MIYRAMRRRVKNKRKPWSLNNCHDCLFGLNSSARDDTEITSATALDVSIALVHLRMLSLDFVHFVFCGDWTVGSKKDEPRWPSDCPFEPEWQLIWKRHGL